MTSDSLQVRRQVLRRVYYAANAAGLGDDRLPPDGLYDTALTNALLVIVSDKWPGEEVSPSGKTKPASQLLELLEEHDTSFEYAHVATLREGLKLTQPLRHGSQDDEFAVLQRKHIDALIALDKRPGLRFLDKVSPERTLSDLIGLAFTERAGEGLPFDPKERSAVPGLEQCEECSRPTFLPTSWDDFGGTMSAGTCIACGYERTDDDADDQAVDGALSRALGQD